jgi:REP element-mobilizing transposase RayT
MSRIVHREFLLDSVEKEHFRLLMRRVAGFCDVRVLTYVLMDNHFHILLRVPEQESGIDDAELFRRMAYIYSNKQVSRVRDEIAGLRAQGREDLVEDVKRRYLYRMHDMSEFMKTLKQCFTQWYNRSHGQTGTLWASRFKSVLIENSENALSRVSTYIDLNPVRARLAEDPKDYRYCGYAEALSGDRQARGGLLDVARSRGPVRSEGEALTLYRRYLCLDDRETPISRAEVEKVIDAGGELSSRQLLACRIRYFSDGLVLGSREFVEEVYRRNREQFGLRRKSGARKLRHGQWDGLCSIRDLRKSPIGLPT